MEPKDPNTFDDSALKDAIRRAWKDDVAPPELIERVRSASSRSSPGIGHRARQFVLAAAALLLIGLALVGYWMRGVTPPSQVATTMLPEPLASQLVDRHDECCKHDDHHMPGLPRSDYAAIATALSTRLGWPVLSAAPGGDWTFAGASICPVGSQNSAHLVFKRGRDDLSVFSLPVRIVGTIRRDTSFDQIEAGHPIASFASGGGLFCIVASSPDGSMTLETTRAIRAELRGRVQAAASAERTTVAGR